MLADTTLQLPVPPGLEHLGPTLSGPAAVVLCQLLGGMLEHAGPDTWLSTNPDTFKSAKGALQCLVWCTVTTCVCRQLNS